jgi:hypothetical protein
MSISVYDYDKINKNDNVFNTPRFKTYAPTPTNDDYTVGYIIRYFIQKANDENGYVFEIDKSYFINFTENPFYTAVQLNWRIKGNAEEVINSNKKSINISYEIMPSLKLYLPNLLQFHKENLEK